MPMTADEPGREHARFDHLLGTWQVEGTIHGMAPEPIPVVGRSTFTRVLGGRFFQEEHEGGPPDHPFRGVGFLGYSNKRHEYQQVWLDNMSTTAHVQHGRYDERSRTLHLEGETIGPDGRPAPTRTEIRIASDRELTYSSTSQLGTMTLRYVKTG